MKEIEIVEDPEKIKIIIEETRRKILSLLRFRDMTISELASILDKDISTIFRHIKKLEKYGFVRVTGERKLHNVPEKIYGRTARTFILAPEGYFKSEELIKKFRKRKIEGVVQNLNSMGYEVMDKTALEKIILYFEELPIEDIERLEKDVDWDILGLLRYILMLLKSDPAKVQELREIIKRV